MFTFGSTLSTTLLGRIADTRGWGDVFNCIFIFSAVAFVMCLVASAVTRKGGTLTGDSDLSDKA